MLPVLALAAHDHGRPQVSGLEWHPPLARELTRPNPFTGKPFTVTIFEPLPDGVLPYPGATISTVTLSDAAAWERSRDRLARCGARLVDGHLAELWMLTMSSDAALAALQRPAWVSADGSAYLIAFPSATTAWLAKLTDRALRQEARHLSAMAPWLRRDADDAASDVAYDLLELVRPLARDAESAGGLLSAHLRARG
jgi:hypothetical protein